MVIVNTDLAQEVLPYSIYDRIQTAHPKEYFTFKIEYSFGYWLRHIKLKYPERLDPTTHAAYQFSKEIKLEIFDNANYRARELDAFTGILISSPGKEGCQKYTAANPVDNNAFSVEFSATPAIKSVSNLNFLYKYGDVIKIDISGMEYNATDGAWQPQYIDIFLEGYYVPKRIFDLVKRKKL